MVFHPPFSFHLIGFSWKEKGLLSFRLMKLWFAPGLVRVLQLKGHSNRTNQVFRALMPAEGGRMPEHFIIKTTFLFYWFSIAFQVAVKLLLSGASLLAAASWGHSLPERAPFSGVTGSVQQLWFVGWFAGLTAVCGRFAGEPINKAVKGFFIFPIALIARLVRVANREDKKDRELPMRQQAGKA